MKEIIVKELIMANKKFLTLCAVISLSAFLNTNVANAADTSPEDNNYINENIEITDADVEKSANEDINNKASDSRLEEDLDSKDQISTFSKDSSENAPLVYYKDINLDELLPLFKEDYQSPDPKPDKEQENNEVAEEKEESQSTYKLKNGTIYQVSDGKEEKAKNTWANIGGHVYFAGKDGIAYQGLQKISGKQYFFDKEYKLTVDQPFIADGGKYYAGQDATVKLTENAKKGWTGLGEKSYYFDEKGQLLRGLQDLGTNRFYFDKIDGLMLRNQIINEGFDKIHTADNGVAHYVGWDYYNGKLGYFNSNGSYTKGLKKIGGMTYGFDNTGKIYNRQYKKIDNKWWYFNKYGEASKSNGNFPRGWIGDRYYFSDGKPAEGLQVINGKTYIFHELTLEKQRNVEKVFNHKRYRTDGNGVARYIGEVNRYPAQAGTRGAFRPGFSKYLNRKTPYFTQNDPRWRYKSYASGNFGGYACGPTVMAMVLNRKLNRNDIYPTTTAIDARPYTAWNGTDWQYLIEGPENYGLKSYPVPVNEKAFIQALKKNPIIVRVGNGYFINAGHYMVIDSYKDGKFYINDPFYSKKNTMEAHDFWRLKQEVTVAWEIK